MVLCNIFPRKARVAPPGLSHFEPMVLLVGRLPVADSHCIPTVSRSSESNAVILLIHAKGLKTIQSPSHCALSGSQFALALR